MQRKWIAPAEALARIVARFDRALAAPTAAYEPFVAAGHVVGWLTPERAQASGVEYVSHDDLFRRSDALFVALKLLDATSGSRAGPSFFARAIAHWSLLRVSTHRRRAPTRSSRLRARLRPKAP